MGKNTLSAEDKKRISAGALLEIVAATLSGPLGVTIPFIGNVLLAIDDKSKGRQEIEDMKGRIDALAQSEQEKIKETLFRLEEQESRIREQEEQGKNKVMIYAVDAVEIMFRGLLEPDVMLEMQDLISEFISGGVDFEDGFMGCDDLNCPVDDAYTSQEGVILNFFEPICREALDLVLERVDMLIQSIDGSNQVKKVVLY